jgi:hypothetical protein
MNYYGKLYSDGNIVHISLVEGLYYIGSVTKARVIGDLNLTERKMIKYTKQSYDIIDLSGEILTLKKYRVDLTTHNVSYDDKYTLLQHILVGLSKTAESISHIIESIDRISTDKRIKSHKNCYTAEYITL